MDSPSSVPPDDDRGPVIDFDHYSAEFNADPPGAWRALADTPVAWSEKNGGFWVVSDHQGNHDVLQNHEVFSSAPTSHGASLVIPIGGRQRGGETEPHWPEALDPPYHTQVRGLLNGPLSPRAARNVQPLIEYWTTACINRVIEAGTCDLLYDVTSPVPAYITLDWLGFPRDRIIEAAQSFHDMVGYPPGSPEFNRALRNDIIRPTLWEACVARREEPRDDLISWLMTQELDGEPLSDQVIVRLGYIVVAGGVDTTTSLASSALVHLNRDRELRQRLIDDPALIEPATEEFLRVYPPLASIGRVARQDTEYRGCPVHAGDRVLVSWQAANQDERVFEAPEEFRVDRFPNRHVSFGLGPHRCAGSHLARLMFQETLRQVLRRMPDYELDEEAIAPYPSRGIFNGWAALPARFTPGKREPVAEAPPDDGRPRASKARAS
jgi:cytochrome P450